MGSGASSVRRQHHTSKVLYKDAKSINMRAAYNKMCKTEMRNIKVVEVVACVGCCLLLVL